MRLIGMEDNMRELTLLDVIGTVTDKAEQLIAQTSVAGKGYVKLTYNYLLHSWSVDLQYDDGNGLEKIFGSMFDIQKAVDCYNNQCSELRNYRIY